MTKEQCRQPPVSALLARAREVEIALDALVPVGMELLRRTPELLDLLDADSHDWLQELVVFVHAVAGVERAASVVVSLAELRSAAESEGTP